MSGPICPDCSLLALEDSEKGRTKCPICGWEGREPPRKIMDADMGSEKSWETQKLLKLRKAGKLAYFRVYLKGTEDQKSDAEWDIMELLEVDQMEGGGNMLFFYMEERPKEEFLEKMRTIKGVKEVEVF